jgi:hypothetical protein
VTTRRNFLGVTPGARAGLAFVGCDLLAASLARRREVVVNGTAMKLLRIQG